MYPSALLVPGILGSSVPPQAAPEPPIVPCWQSEVGGGHRGASRQWQGPSPSSHLAPLLWAWVASRLLESPAPGPPGTLPCPTAVPAPAGALRAAEAAAPPGTTPPGVTRSQRTPTRATPQRHAAPVRPPRELRPRPGRSQSLGGRSAPPGCAHVPRPPLPRAAAGLSGGGAR